MSFTLYTFKHSFPSAVPASLHPHDKVFVSYNICSVLHQGITWQPCSFTVYTFLGAQMHVINTLIYLTEAEIFQTVLHSLYYLPMHAASLFSEIIIFIQLQGF